MARLHIVAEGQTEETFVNRTLKLHLATFEVWVDVRCVETSRSRGKIYRGGVATFQKVRDDIERWSREDNNQDSWFTTMFDLYRLPTDFPSFDESAKYQTPMEKVNFLEEKFKYNIDSSRFIPYIQLHEFEALLFASPENLVRAFPDHAPAVQRLVSVRQKFNGPEDIDETPAGAPSKRITQEIPEYDGMKVSAGPQVADSIGLDVLRKECGHFGAWLQILENLSGA